MQNKYILEKCKLSNVTHKKYSSDLVNIKATKLVIFKSQAENTRP